MSSIGEAIGRADAGANAEWKEAALEIVRSLAQRKSTLTTDEVWQALNARGLSTPEHRAMGPVMLKARKNGWVDLATCNSCQTTKVMVASERPEAHGMDIAVYRSLLVKPKRSLFGRRT